VSVALVTQREKGVRRVMQSPVACPVLPNFSTLSHKRNDFRKEKSYSTQNVGFDFLYNFCQTQFSF
jgi:hypothetical protein